MVDQAAFKIFQKSTCQIKMIHKHYGAKISSQLLRNSDVQFKIWLTEWSSEQGEQCERHFTTEAFDQFSKTRVASASRGWGSDL